MANSKFAYVRSFELPDPLLPNTYIVLRIDGHAFHKLAEKHEFHRPNDERALSLMDKAARTLLEEYPDIVLGFGESDEYRSLSFEEVMSTVQQAPKSSKIVSMLTSLFTSAYVFHWPAYFPDTPLAYPPSFDGRVILYPTQQEIRDYFAWRQVDTHINNLYNTTFWALVQQGGMTAREAETKLKGTLSKDKHEILFQSFGVNYNTLPEQFKKGSILLRESSDMSSAAAALIDHAEVPDGAAPQDQSLRNKRNAKKKLPTVIRILHADVVQDEFWAAHPDLLT